MEDRHPTLPHHSRHQTLPNSHRTAHNTQLSLHSRPSQRAPILKQFSGNNKIPINQYLSMMRRGTGSNWSKEKINKVQPPTPWLTQPKFKSHNEWKLRMSEIVSRRRHVKINDQHIDADLFRKHKLGEIVNSILGCYEYYQKFEYSDSKITSIVKNYCQEKKELEWILLRKIKSELNPSEYSVQYRKSADDIVGKLLRTIICKIDQHKNIIIRDIISFKESLEEDLIEKGTGRIQHIKQSINQGKMELSCKLTEVDELYPKIRRHKVFHKSLPEEEIEKIIANDEFPHAFPESSRVNRLLYKHFNAALRC